MLIQFYRGRQTSGSGATGLRMLQLAAAQLADARAQQLSRELGGLVPCRGLVRQARDRGFAVHRGERAVKLQVAGVGGVIRRDGGKGAGNLIGWVAGIPVSLIVGIIITVSLANA